VKYIRTRLNASKYWPLGGGFIFSLSAEGGYIHSLEGERVDATGQPVDAVRLTDRFFLGNPQIRGFDIRGIGPRVKRFYLTKDSSGNYVENTSNNNVRDDALGGKIYYLTRAEVEIPLGSGAREMGLRPSIFIDAGAVGGLRNPALVNNGGTFPGFCSVTSGTTAADGTKTPTSTTTERAPALGSCQTAPVVGANYTDVTYVDGSGFREVYLGDTLKPRVAIGFGVNWNSPFGPFRIDIAKALLKEPGDDTQLISFNVGTQF